MNLQLSAVIASR